MLPRLDLWVRDRNRKIGNTLGSTLQLLLLYLCLFESLSPPAAQLGIYFCEESPFSRDLFKMHYQEDRKRQHQHLAGFKPTSMKLQGTVPFPPKASKIAKLFFWWKKRFLFPFQTWLSSWLKTRAAARLFTKRFSERFRTSKACPSSCRTTEPDLPTSTRFIRPSRRSKRSLKWSVRSPSQTTTTSWTRISAFRWSRRLTRWTGFRWDRCPCCCCPCCCCCHSL